MHYVIQVKPINKPAWQEHRATLEAAMSLYDQYLNDPTTDYIRISTVSIEREHIRTADGMEQIL